MEDSHYQYGGEYAGWTCHIISTEESVQYRTIKTAQGVDGGLIYLGKQYFTDNPDFILLWLNPDAFRMLI